MKKSVFLIGGIIWAGIALAALVILLLGLSGSASAGRFQWFRGGANMSSMWDSSTLVKEERFSLAEITALEIGTQYQDIRIALVEGQEMTVRQYDIDETTQFAADLYGSRLSLNTEHKNRVTFSMATNSRLEIDLPREYAHSVALAASSGAINLYSAAQWGDTSLSSNSGDIRFKDGLTCGSLEIVTSSGSVNIGDIKADSLDIRTNSGDVRLNELQASGSIALKSSSGSLNCGSVISTNFAVYTNSGDMRIGNVTANSGVEITSSSGSQNLGSVKAETFIIKSNSGSLRYSGICGQGSIENSSGSINCGALELRGNVIVSSNSGDQRLTLTAGQNFEITISTNSGSIRAMGIDLSYSDNKGKNAFATVGDGSGGTLSITTSSGSVNIN
jgi:DUF4097 and DUF4098 domain-containing protein YvlB